MLLSERIARLIEEMILENDGSLELQRNKLADSIGCVPSQITYVITSRFSTERGYIVESRRGGGGFIKITKITLEPASRLKHLLKSVGDSIDESTAKSVLFSLYEDDLIDEREYRISSVLTTEKALSEITDKKTRDMVRAEMLKSFLLAIQD